MKQLSNINKTNCANKTVCTFLVRVEKGTNKKTTTRPQDIIIQKQRYIDKKKRKGSQSKTL